MKFISLICFLILPNRICRNTILNSGVLTFDANKIFVIVPCYNESCIISTTITALLQQGYKVIVVDDGSNNNCREHFSTMPVYYLQHAINLGQGAAIQTGIDFALQKGAEYLVTFDADGQHDVKDIGKMIHKLEAEKLEFVFGSRFLEGAQTNVDKTRRALLHISRFTNFFISGVLLSDSNNGLRVFTSMFGRSEGRGRSSHVKFRGQDYNAELQLELLDAYKTHQQTLTVNGKNIRITIPAGIENGQKIKLKGHGGPGINGGPNGDLYITFSIADHPRFKRMGNDIYTTVNLDLYTAVLGGEVTIETLDGKVNVKVKPETQNGSKIKLKGKGFPVYKKEGEFGDLYITYSIKIPTNLTDKQRELFTELSKT
jgi:glycosyltransferase involved in cell wall biosynthesis